MPRPFTDNPKRISAPADPRVVKALNDISRKRHCAREVVIQTALAEYVAIHGDDLVRT